MRSSRSCSRRSVRSFHSQHKAAKRNEGADSSAPSQGVTVCVPVKGNSTISRLFRCLPPSVKLHKPRLLWNLYGIRLECLLESPFYRPVPYIFARHFQNFFIYFWISEKNIFLGISSSSVIFEKYFFKPPNFFRIFCFFSLQLSLYGMLHSFFEKVKIENKKSHTQSACGIKLYSFSRAACGGAFHPGAARAP